MRAYEERDILIIGAGAIGCAVAGKLARYDLDILVIEKDSDVAGETSGRNSAVVHAGFNNEPGTLMAELCVEGNRGFEALCRRLDVPYRKTGKLVAATREEEIPGLEALYEKGIRNGCRGIRMIGPEEAREMVPGVNAVKALYSRETAITNPFLYCVALAENAAENGVEFRFCEKVTGVSAGGTGSDGSRVEGPGTESDRSACGYVVETTQGTYHSKIIVNCAGLGAPEIAAMAGAGKYDIFPCRGQYCILDVDKDAVLPMPVYPAPGAGGGGLGVHLTPTIEGNVILGPSAEYIDEKDDYAVTADVIERLIGETGELLPAASGLRVIGSYSGIRPKLTPPDVGGYSDFIIREEDGFPGFISLVGIESPGLTASWPIAGRVASIVEERLGPSKKEDWIGTRRDIPRFRDLDDASREALIEKDPEYGEIFCRCRKISKAEIRAAAENRLGVRTMSAIKYRAWATTGRCSGGYCMPKIADFLVREYGMDPSEILYRNEGSNMFIGEVK